MTSKMKRPLSIWIAQIILGIYSLGTVLILFWGAYKGLTEGITNPELFLMTTLGVLTFAAIFAGGVYGMAIRKPWGRWLGVAGLAILLIGAAITQTSRRFSSGDWESGFGSVGLMFSILVVGGLAFLVYTISAGDAAEEFFNGKSVKVVDREPFDAGR